MFEKESPDSRDDLLLRLQERASCTYLSDLHLPIFRSRIQTAVLDISAEEFSVSAWNAALRYIAGCSGEITSAVEARAELLARLNQ